jgi:hypothetical protein
MYLFSQDTAVLQLHYISQVVFCQFALILNPTDGRGELHFFAIRKIFIILKRTFSDNIFYTLQRVCRLVFVCIVNKLTIYRYNI